MIIKEWVGGKKTIGAKLKRWRGAQYEVKMKKTLKIVDIYIYISMI